MEQLSTKELIDEVAKRHGIMLDEKDPILVTLTLNELIVENYIKAVEASIAKVNTRQIETAKLVGEEIVSKGAHFLVAEISKAEFSFDKLTSSHKMHERHASDSNFAIVISFIFGAFTFWLFANLLKQL